MMNQNNKADYSQVSWPQAILHLDMDAFFVNVHLLEHPEDVGIPLAVGGQPQHRGVIASASYEARKRGIHSAMPSATALRKCPELKIVGSTWPSVSEKSRQVMDILRQFGAVEQVSVDEAYVDLSETDIPGQMAAEIRRKVKAETGLPASVGLSMSKLVAKVASDHDKPEGCTIVLPGEEAAFLAPLSVRVIPGIGVKTAEKLAELDIKTCGELANKELSELQKQFGRHAAALQRRAIGIDSRGVSTERGRRKSISHERTFSRDVVDADVLEEKLQEMAARIVKSLQKRGMVAHTVRVKFRWSDFTTFTRQTSFEVGTDSQSLIYGAAIILLKKHWGKEQPVRLIGLGVSGLEKPEVRQFDFGF